MPDKPPEWWNVKTYAGKDMPYYEKLWNDLLNEAQIDKEWAEKKKDDKEWNANACEVSKNMLKGRLESSAKDLAIHNYKYLHHRAHATGKSWGVAMPLDMPARRRWEELTGEVI